METTWERTPRQAEEARAAAVVYEALAEALLNLPDERVLADVAQVARLLGAEGFDGFAADAALEQRFYDRLFAAASPLFVPLGESSIRGGGTVDGARRYGPTSDARTDHVLACYRAAGFDPAALAGHELAVGTARPDGLASELAFMAYLARAEASAGSDEQALGLRGWQDKFLDAHLGCWAAAAADALASTDDDFYARVVALAAAWVELDRERVRRRDRRD